MCFECDGAGPGIVCFEKLTADGFGLGLGVKIFGCFDVIRVTFGGVLGGFVVFVGFVGFVSLLAELFEVFLFVLGCSGTDSSSFSESSLSSSEESSS